MIEAAESKGSPPPFRIGIALEGSVASVRPMKRAPLLSLLPLLWLVGCNPESGSSTNLLIQEERAPQFDRVAGFLDLGGVFYAYMDLTDEIDRFGTILNEVASALKESDPDMPPIPLDLKRALRASGLTGIQAIGMSSREMEAGIFHNRSILYFPEGPVGLFEIFGNVPHPFDSLDMAPESTDLVFEMSYRPAVLRDGILEMAAAIGGIDARDELNAELSKPCDELEGMNLDELIDSLGNRIFLIFDFAEEGEPIFLGPGISMPEIRYLVAVDGATDLISSFRDSIEAEGNVIWTETDTGFEVEFTEPISREAGNFTPLIVADKTTERVFFASSREFLEECLANGGKLRDSKEFKRAANLLPPEGISFVFVSPSLFDPFKDAFTQGMNSSPVAIDQRVVDQVTEFMFASFEKPTAGVTTVGPEGIYSASNAATSHRSTIFSVASQPLALVGFSAAMAIPAFQKVRENARQKTILNNLRQIASGGQQYLLEEGADSVRYDQLVGEYFPEIESVAGENYGGLTVTRSGTLSVITANGEVVEYTY